MSRWFALGLGVLVLAIGYEHSRIGELEQRLEVERYNREAADMRLARDFEASRTGK